MKKSPAYNLGEELFKVGVKERRRVEGYREGGPANLAQLRRMTISGGQFEAWIALGDYVEKNFRRKKK